MSTSSKTTAGVFTATVTISLLGILAVACYLGRKRRTNTTSASCCAYETMIGQTPTILLPRLSKLLNCQVFVKLENVNPGGTGKDRAAQRMIQVAEQSGLLPPPHYANTASSTDSDSFTTRVASHPTTALSSSKSSSCTNDEDNDRKEMTQLIFRALRHSRTGGLVVEGTSGSTGICLTTLCVARGHGIIVVLPDDQAAEKARLLKILGAEVHIVKVCSIAHPNHYVKTAQRIARLAKQQYGIRSFFPNQFENIHNYNVHFETTGPEIYQYRPDIFVMSAGTGGTIAGVGAHLKSRNAAVQVVLVDPPGSVLANKVNHNVAFTVQQTERELLRHRYDSLAEGIGLDRVTHNLQKGLHCIDTALTITDQEAVDMAHWMLHNEGLLIGSSSAMNLVGVCKMAKTTKAGARILTILCDSGQRHLTRFWNQEFVEKQRGLVWPDSPHHVPDFLLSNATR